MWVPPTGRSAAAAPQGAAPEEAEEGPAPDPVPSGNRKEGRKRFGQHGGQRGGFGHLSPLAPSASPAGEGTGAPGLRELLKNLKRARGGLVPPLVGFSKPRGAQASPHHHTTTSLQQPFSGEMAGAGEGSGGRGAGGRSRGGMPGGNPGGGERGGSSFAQAFAQAFASASPLPLSLRGVGRRLSGLFGKGAPAPPPPSAPPRPGSRLEPNPKGLSRRCVGEGRERLREVVQGPEGPEAARVVRRRRPLRRRPRELGDPAQLQRPEPRARRAEDEQEAVVELLLGEGPLEVDGAKGGRSRKRPPGLARRGASARLPGSARREPPRRSRSRRAPRLPD